jgi:hypothetical protein
MVLKYRDDIINLSVANDALIKRNEHATETIKELQKLNFQIRSASSVQDQLGKCFVFCYIKFIDLNI